MTLEGPSGRGVLGSAELASLPSWLCRSTVSWGRVYQCVRLPRFPASSRLNTPTPAQPCLMFWESPVMKPLLKENMNQAAQLIEQEGFEHLSICEDL